MIDQLNHLSLMRFRIIRAALMTFIATIPFYVTGVNYLAYYLGFLLSFVVIADLALSKKTIAFSKQLFNQRPIVALMLLGWIISSIVSLAWVWFDDASSTRQLVTSFLRHLYDLNILAFVIVLSRLIFIKVIKGRDVFISLALGFMCMIAIQVFMYHGLPIAADLWFSEPPFGPHIRDQGNLACVVAVSFAAWFLTDKKKASIKLVMIGCLFLIGFSFVIWSGGRMAMSATAITLFFLALLHLFSTREKRFLRLFVLLVLMGCGFLIAEKFSVYPWNGVTRIFADTPQAATIDLSQAQAINQLTTGRLQMWTMSVDAMLESPWFGLGPYGYFFIPERVYDDQPHNFIIQFLVEWGGVGASLMLLLMLVFAWSLTKQVVRMRKVPDVDLVMAASVICVLTLHGLTGGTYFKIQPLTCLAVAFSVVVAEIYRTKLKSPQ